MLENSFKKCVSLDGETAQQYHEKFLELMDSSEKAQHEVEAEWKGEKAFY